MTIFEEILEMFASEEAKENFIALCRKYYEERSRMKRDHIAGRPTRNPRRTEIHNQIMEIYAKLRLSNDADRFPVYSRKEIGKAIMEYFRKTPLDS